MVMGRCGKRGKTERENMNTECQGYEFTILALYLIRRVVCHRKSFVKQPPTTSYLGLDVLVPLDNDLALAVSSEVQGRLISLTVLGNVVLYSLLAVEDYADFFKRNT